MQSTTPSSPSVKKPSGTRESRRHTPKVNMSGLYQRAVREAFLKLDPRIQVKNPVMFMVWVGTLITALVTLDPNIFGTVSADAGAQRLLNGLITFILFFTVLFANFAEAVAEGRGKAKQMHCAPRDQTPLPVSFCPMAPFKTSAPRHCVAVIRSR
jgi:potassium-transporting ATPase ATP-binding subunit